MDNLEIYLPVKLAGIFGLEALGKLLSPIGREYLIFLRVDGRKNKKIVKNLNIDSFIKTGED